MKTKWGMFFVRTRIGVDEWLTAFLKWSRDALVPVAPARGRAGSRTLGRFAFFPAFLLLATTALVQADDYSYTTNSDNTITITGYTGAGGAVSITNEINGLTVTCIGSNAFYQCASLINVTIPNSVTSIGQWAFAGCFGLTSVTIPDSVTNIEDFAFFYCAGLTNIIIGSNVTTIGYAAFIYSSLITISIPDSVTTIGDHAFGDCEDLQYLTSVTIGKNVTYIGQGAFSMFICLTNVYFKGNAPAVDLSGFSGDYRATIYYLPGTTGWGPTLDGQPTAIWNIFSYTTNSDNTNTITITGFNQTPPVSNVTIPNTISNLTVKSIGDNALEGCTNLIGVTIPNSATNIGNWTFDDCKNLTNVVIGNGVISIGSDAFSRCVKLTSITIPGNVKIIGDYAFSCPPCWPMHLTSVTIGDGVVSIGVCAFAGTPLTNVTIPNSVTNVGCAAFDDCTNLTTVSIGTGLTSIGEAVFCGCTRLTSITIPANVTFIGGGEYGETFYYCISLKAVYFKGNAPVIGYLSDAVFADAPATVYYLPGTKGWSTNLDICPASLWLPQICSSCIQSNQFSFSVNWASGMTAVVECCTNLLNSSWQPVQTNTMSADSIYFSDPNWTNHPTCFYRIRWQ